jgi:Zn-dependent oligopeptidase
MEQHLKFIFIEKLICLYFESNKIKSEIFCLISRLFSMRLKKSDVLLYYEEMRVYENFDKISIFDIYFSVFSYSRRKSFRISTNYSKQKRVDELLEKKSIYYDYCIFHYEQ